MLAVLFRRLALAALAVAALLPAGAAEARPAGLATRLAQALAVPHLDHRSEGAIAVDLTTGRVLFARNADRPLVPASNAKIPVTYSVLVAFGPQYRIRTAVYAAPDGNLVLKGYGDPTLSTGDLRALARRVRSTGLRSVRRVLADESFFDTARVGAGWKPSYYILESPPLSALVVDRARSGRVTSRDPALMAAAVFKAALKGAGVRVSGPVGHGVAAGDEEALAAVLSPPMSALVHVANTDSDNFTAELLLKQLGALVQLPGTSAAGARVIRDILEAAAVPVDGLHIADGSGLSSLDRISARTLAAILEAAYLHPGLRETFRRSLAVAGRTGTLGMRMRATPAWGAVFAKTGTTRLASSLAGYAGDRYVFAVLHNGRPIATSSARKAQDRFAAALARG
jgi:D-alanyl-D-alanine carboxypeptidase/D-alanyl-D-alanine-endopeptidase (penicillin-binding protein 4)